MKYLVIIFCIVLIACQSNPPQRQVPITESEQINNRLEAVALPADSATLIALFECDSLNNVILRQLSDEKTKGWQSFFSFYNGLLKYNLKQPPDTVYVPVTDTTRYKEIPVEVPVPYEVEKIVKVEKELSTWQKTRQTLGDILLILIGVSFLTLILKWKKLL